MSETVKEAMYVITETVKEAVYMITNVCGNESVNFKKKRELMTVKRQERKTFARQEMNLLHNVDGYG